MRFPSLAAAAVLLAATLTACSDDPQPRADTTPGASPSETSRTAGSPTDEPTADGSGEPADPTSGGTVVPAYFVGDTPQGPRLYREFRRVEGDALTEAARLIAGGVPEDPDYRTLWPAVEIAGVEATDGVLLVRLADDGFTTRPDGMGKQAARLALQQLVYTLQGVQQARVPVQFLREDGPATLFGIPIEEPVEQAPPLDVLAHVSISDPAEGATVSDGSLEARGVASSFEATVPWEVRRGDEVLLEGFATAEGWMDRLYPWQTTVDVSSLEPGDYTFVAMTADPSGGAEGPGPMVDTRSFTVE